MKKIRLLLLTVFVSLLVFSVDSVYAQESDSFERKSSALSQSGRKNDSWILFGYSISWAAESDVWAPLGPVTFTGGGDIWRFIGFELTLATSWSTDDRTYSFQGKNFVDKGVTWSFDIKPYLLLQPKIGIDLISLRPYFGIGPAFYLSGSNYATQLIGSKHDDYSFDVGFSTKLGLRLQALKFLFVGTGIEYVYHETKLQNVKDMSAFLWNIDLGFIW